MCSLDYLEPQNFAEKYEERICLYFCGETSLDKSSEVFLAHFSE